MYARLYSIMKLIDRGHNSLKAEWENNIHMWKNIFAFNIMQSLHTENWMNAWHFDVVKGMIEKCTKLNQMLCAINAYFNIFISKRICSSEMHKIYWNYFCRKISTFAMHVIFKKE